MEVTVWNHSKKFAPSFVKVKPYGLASPNLDNRPQILSGFPYRYPSSVQMHVIFTISTFRTFYPLSIDFSSILCIIAFCGLLRRSLRGYIARFQQGGELAGYPLDNSARPIHQPATNKIRRFTASLH